MGFNINPPGQVFDGSGWSSESSALSAWSDNQLTPPKPPSAVGPSESLFTPKFMKALQMFTGSIPVIDIEAKNSTFVDTIMKNKPLREGMFKLALFLCSTVPELIDKEKHPRAYGMSVFARNVLALERIRQELKTKFVIRGGTNLDIWKALVPQVTGKGKEDEISYVPPGINCIGTIMMPLNCHPVDANILYGMCEYGKSGKTFSANAWSGFGSIPTEVRSVYWYGPEIQSADDGTSKVTIMRKDTGTEWYWLQVFEVQQHADILGNSLPPVYIVFLAQRNNLGTKPNEMPTALFMQSYVISKVENLDSLHMTMYEANQRMQHTGVANSILKSLKYSMFNPSSTVILTSMFTGGEESYNKVMFVKRVTKYSGADAVHILKEYDTIRDGIGRCLEKGMSRGYAFVGLPGTGKTIMMNQLVNEFPDIPVIKFSMQCFDTPKDFKHPSFSTVLVETIQSLNEAGFDKVFLCCDDMDSVDLSAKNKNVESIITLMDSVHAMNMAIGSVIFMATINDPTSMHSSIIKRGNRIDEVIEVPCPDRSAISRLINHVKRKDDPTDYTAPNFESAISRMADEHLSLADMATMMSNMQIYGNTGDDGKFTPEHVMKAIDRILLSRENASKQYEL